MYYLELIERFWEFYQNQKLGATSIAMYLYLLKIGYENDRYDFRISDVKISEDLGITRKTVKATKEKLRDFGLIQFQTKAGFPCSYRLILNYSLTKFKEKTSFETETKVKSEVKKEEIIEQSFIQEIQSNDEVTLLQLEKHIHKNTAIPSLEEFKEYAKTLDFYNQTLDFEIQTKYENWKKNGWKNNFGKPISNWKSSLKSILPYLKNSETGQKPTNQIIPTITRPKINSKD